MGRGRSGTVKNSSRGGGGNALISQLTDNTDFRAWIKENMSNPEFKQFGRDHSMSEVKDLWYQKRASVELKNLHEISKEDAIAKIADSVDSSTRDGWFRNADSDYKPRLIDQIMSNSGTLNAGLNIAYSNYKDDCALRGKTPKSFNTWLNTPQTMYRGDRGQKAVGGDIFLSYSMDRRVAERFGSNITSIRIKPIDTWGSYQTTSEQEFLVPIGKARR